MVDEKERPVRGEVGHPFYRKDLGRGLKFDKKGSMISQGPPELGVTDTNTPGLKGSDLPKTPAGTPDPRGIYTKSIAKGFNKNEQMNLLMARKVRTTRKDTEVILIAKILDSNPKDEPEEQTEPASPDVTTEPDAAVPDETTQERTAPQKYTEDELKDFKVKKLVEILKALGCKRQPMTEKGKIKKIVELQK